MIRFGCKESLNINPEINFGRSVANLYLALGQGVIKNERHKHW
jgi:hypothetical protein